MRIITYFLLFIIILLFCNCITDPIKLKAAIKRDAENSAKFLLAGDVANYVNYIYPLIIKDLGGKKKAIIAIKKFMIDDMGSAGGKFTAITFEEPSEIITFRKEMQCTIVQNSRIDLPDKYILSKSVLIALSSDKGKHWTFLETKGQDIKTMRSLYPNLSNKLLILNYGQPKTYTK